jgi:hypothetical protein
MCDDKWFDPASCILLAMELIQPEDRHSVIGHSYLVNVLLKDQIAYTRRNMIIYTIVYLTSLLVNFTPW